jgi:hypothetical protein
MKTTPQQAYGSDLAMEFNVNALALRPGEVAPGAGELGVREGKVAPTAEVTVEEAAALELTAEQRVAIVKLTSGRTRGEAANAAGVSRMTLYRWLNHDPAFQAAYNAWEQDVLMTAQGQLAAGTQDAVATVLGAIRGGDSKLAWKLLESQGVSARPAAGSTDVEELRRREVLERKKREVAERKERNAVARADLETEDWQLG